MGLREYLKNGPLGFGAAPLGNMFRNIPDDEAAATVREKGDLFKAAALHFSLAHPASAAVILGASKSGRISEDRPAMNTVVPEEFWKELRKQKLVSPLAPLPIDRK